MNNKYYGTIKQQITKKDLNIYNLFKELTHISKSLYNQALYTIRQEYFNNKKYLNYNNLDKILKNDENYKLLQSGCSQQVLKIVDQNFKSFFALLKKKKQNNSKNKINIPKYLDKEGYFKICDAESMKHIHKKDDKLYCSKAKGLSELASHWTVPMSKEFLKGGMILFDGSIVQSHDRIKIQIPDILQNKYIKQIWIIPKNKGNYFEIQYVYEIIKKINLKKKNNNLLSIDLGINNLCTCVSYKENDKNKFKSFILDGKKLKSINQFYNKQINKLQQLAIKDNKAPYFTKKMYNITRKRNNKIIDYIHKICKYIIDYCLMNKINTIILGYNQNIKQNINIGKRNNQNFVNIPFYKIKENLKYRSELNNIELIIQEESYTSKANFINNDYIPIYTEEGIKTIDEKVELKKIRFSGRRPKHGKYIFTNNSSSRFKINYINADMNGSLNIMRKYLNRSKVVNSMKLVNDFNTVLCHRGVLLTPIRIKVK